MRASNSEKVKAKLAELRQMEDRFSSSNKHEEEKDSDVKIEEPDSSENSPSEKREKSPTVSVHDEHEESKDILLPGDNTQLDDSPSKSKK